MTMRKQALLFIIAVLFSASFLFAQTGNNNGLTTGGNTKSIGDSIFLTKPTDSIGLLRYYRDSLVTELLAYAKTFLGVPYRWAGRSRAGFDCSGFVMTMFAHIGVPLSPSAVDMSGSGRVVPDSTIRRGDILFFVNTQRYRTGIGHVALAYEVKNGDVIFIHSACNGGVRFDYLSSAYYSKHYFKAERISIFDVP